MMILPWVMDYNTGKLTCKITDDLIYEAISGGYEGYYKSVRNNTGGEFVTTFIDSDYWEKEKYWIDYYYSDIVGSYEPGDPNKFEKNPRGKNCAFAFGRDPEGARLDHLQRPQALMEAEDCAIIIILDQTKYETPDQGLTVLKTLPLEGSKTNYANKDDGTIWTEVPQPCHMQPWIQGRKLATHEELYNFIKSYPEHEDKADEIVSKCRRGEWKKAPRPDLQKFYVYPSK